MINQKEQWDAINLALGFQRVWQKEGAIYDSLDKWLVGLSKYVLTPRFCSTASRLLEGGAL